jgi:hypothetical protein
MLVGLALLAGTALSAQDVKYNFMPFLKSDPQMRAAFINRIAPPIANKMFDCGMIP